MSAYPTSLRIKDESYAEPVESRILQRATNGALKTRMMHSTEKLSFTVLHDLSTAERSTLDSHYSSNKTASFSFTFKSTAYTVVYAAKPAYRHFPSGYSVATVRLEEV